MAGKKVNIFISHHHCDEKHIESFKKKLEGKYDLRDSSIVETNPNNATNPDYIKSEYLRPSIDWAGKMVVLIGKKTKDSIYVDYEIEYANSKGYPIIAVYLPDSTEADLPDALEYYGDSFVEWDNNSGLIEAIEGSVISNDSTGSPRPSVSGSGEVC